MIALKLIPTGDKDLQLIQANVQQVITAIQNTPFIGGNLISEVELTAGQDNLVAHKLGRTPTTWVICDQDTNATVWRTDWDSTFLTLHSSANCTVKVWVNG